MIISEEQLEVWANPPSSVKSQTTHLSIRERLANSTALEGFVLGTDYEMYLQGSYPNSTNIRGDSDVDIIVEYKPIHYHNIENLSLAERADFHQGFIVRDGPYESFRQQVLQGLVEVYGVDNVTIGKKSLKLRGNDYRLNADIVPSVTHKTYLQFSSHEEGGHQSIEGIQLKCQATNADIISYPKAHISNGEQKNLSTSQNYKPLVRILKNSKRKMIEDGEITAELASSYFLECMLYNVPNDLFSGSYQKILKEVIEYLLNRCNPNVMTAVNGRHLLFGAEPSRWDQNDAANFLLALKQFYGC